MQSALVIPILRLNMLGLLCHVMGLCPNCLNQASDADRQMGPTTGACSDRHRAKLGLAVVPDLSAIVCLLLLFLQRT